MKYFTIILGLTLLWSSPGSGYIRSFFLMWDIDIERIFEFLGSDNWTKNLLPFNETELPSFCKELEKAQKIIPVPPINIQFPKPVVNARIKNPEGSTAEIQLQYLNLSVETVGFYCTNRTKVILTNKNLNGHLLFNVQELELNLDAVILYFLSYEEAIQKTYNNIPTLLTDVEVFNWYNRLLLQMTICASVIQGLSSTKVYPYEYYFININDLLNDQMITGLKCLATLEDEIIIDDYQITIGPTPNTVTVNHANSTQQTSTTFNPAFVGGSGSSSSPSVPSPDLVDIKSIDHYKLVVTKNSET